MGFGLITVVVCVAFSPCVKSSGDIETNVTTAGNHVTVADLQRLKSQLADQNRTIAQLKQALEKMGYAQTGEKLRTSFLAVHTGSQEVASGGVVQFQRVRHSTAPPNFGYDNKISFFRCPYSATYVFHANLVTGVYNTDYRFSLVKEGTTLVTSYTRTHSGSSNFAYNTMALSAVTPCAKGEDVWVKNVGQTRSLYSTYDGITHFTGYNIN